MHALGKGTAQCLTVVLPRRVVKEAVVGVSSGVAVITRSIRTSSLAEPVVRR